MIPTVPDFLPASSEYFLCLGLIVLLIKGLFKVDGKYTSAIAPFFVLCALITLHLIPKNHIYTFSGSFLNDKMAFVAKNFLLFITFFILLLIPKERQSFKAFEIPILILLSVLGMMVMVSSTDFIVAFISLELSSLCLYILTSLDKNYKQSSEAGIKYFTYGAISTAFFLFGASFLYGITGSTHFDNISSDLAVMVANKEDLTLAVIGTTLILLSFAFKLAAAPLHYWLADVYQGTSLFITTLIGTLPKFAFLMLCMRFLSQAVPDLSMYWKPILTGFAILSLLLGTLHALSQTNIKRFLAYSGTMNLGFILLALAQGTEIGFAAAGFYQFIYTLTLFGIFAILISLEKNGYEIHTFQDLIGIAHHYPLTGFAFGLFIVSLTGLPPLPGFLGKAYILYAVLLQDQYFLALFALLCSVVATGYYLRFLKALIIDTAHSKGFINHHKDPISKLCIIILSVFLSTLIFFPNMWIYLTHKTAIDLMNT